MAGLHWTSIHNPAPVHSSVHLLHSLFSLLRLCGLAALSLLLLSVWITTANSVPLTPDKDITVVNKQEADPLWKQLWDDARSLAQQQQYAAAVQKYQAILEQKPNIEEVKWELCKVYITIEDYEAASILLEGLLETDNSRIEYLLSGGTLAFLEGRFEQAVSYYGQALETEPDGIYADEALQGLAHSLSSAGQDYAAIPLMEQLYQRSSIDPELLHRLAFLTWEAGFVHKSAHYYKELITKYRVKPEVIWEAAEISESSGRIEDAANYWELYLADNPEYLPYHEKIAEYYLAEGEREEALSHLDILIEKDVKRDRYLLAAADIYLYDIGRIDRALTYYERYQREFPAGKDVSGEITNLRIILANDLLSIVENSGVWMLWRDLAIVTPERIAIYRVMADMLEELGRTRELIEILQIIIVHEPGDADTRVRLAALLKAKKDYEGCVVYLDDSDIQGPLPDSFLILRAGCAETLGNEISSLQDYLEFLKNNPGDDATRMHSIRMTGALGMIGELNNLFDTIPKEVYTDQPRLMKLIRAYLDGLLANRFYTEAESIVQTLLLQDWTDPAVKPELKRFEASILLEQDRTFEAERVLRQLVAETNGGIEPYLLLARLAIKQQNLDDAAAWLTIAQGETRSEDQGDTAAIKSELFYHNLLLSELSSGSSSAAEQAVDYLVRRNSGRALIDNDVDILVFAAGYYIKQKDYRKATELLTYYKKVFRSEKVVDQLIQIVEKQNQIIVDIDDNSDPRPAETSERLTQTLERGELLLQLGRYSDLSESVAPVLEQLPGSVRTRALLSEGALASLDYESANKHYLNLADTYPDQTYFLKQLSRIRYLRGDNRGIIEKYEAGSPPEISTEAQNLGTKSLNELVEMLFYARALWAENRWDEALAVYDRIYLELNKRISESMLDLKTTPEYKTFNPRSFWEDLLYSPEDEEHLDVLMSPFHFVQIRGSDAAQITAEIYDTYRWHKIVKIEKDAKNSLNAKEFYQAEKDYQELIETDTMAPEDAYPDLATVLNRLGKRKKEAELLEKIKELNLEYPVLKEAAEKDVRQRKPHLTVEAKYREEEGRQGYKDITQKYLGGEFSLTPTVSQEAGIWIARNEYGNSGSTTMAKSFYVIAKHAMRLNQYVDTRAALGFEDFDTDGKSFLLYDLAVDATLEGGVGLYASLEQEPVDDTITSLAEGIYHRDFKAGLTFEYLPSLFAGFDFSVIDYSDENNGREFNVWGAYRFFTERSSFDLMYDYQKIENKIANSADTSSSTQAFDEGLSYWSPGSYWKHLLSAEYKLELWQTGRLQSGTSYFSSRYGLGYEKGDNLLQELELNILLEINKIFLLKGTFDSEWSSDYDRLEGIISLSYRW